MSRQKAINAKCKDCIYDPQCGGGTWRQQVEACTITTCPLWPYRPKARTPVKPTAGSAAEQGLQPFGDGKTGPSQTDLGEGA